MQGPQPTVQQGQIPRFRCLGQLLADEKSSEPMVPIVNKSQKPNKKAVSSEGIIRLLLIILWAVVVVVLGFYSGFAYHHH